MTNSVHDLGEKTAIFQRLFSYVHFGELLLHSYWLLPKMNSAPQNEQLLLLPSYWSLPKMNSAPQNEQLLFLPSNWLLPKMSVP